MPEPEETPQAPRSSALPSALEQARTSAVLRVVFSIAIGASLLCPAAVALFGANGSTFYVLAVMSASLLVIVLVLCTALTLFDPTAYSRHPSIRRITKGIVGAVSVGACVAVLRMHEPQELGWSLPLVVVLVATLAPALRASDLLVISAWRLPRGAASVDAATVQRIKSAVRRMLRIAFVLVLAGAALWGATWLPPLQDWWAQRGLPIPKLFDRRAPPMILLLNLPLLFVMAIGGQVASMARFGRTTDEIQRRLAQWRGVNFLEFLLLFSAIALLGIGASAENLLARRVARVRERAAPFAAAFTSDQPEAGLDAAAFAAASRAAAIAGLPSWLSPVAWPIDRERAGNPSARATAAPAPDATLAVAFPIGRTIGLAGTTEEFLLLAPADVDFPAIIKFVSPTADRPDDTFRETGFELPEREGRLAWIRVTRRFR